MNNQHKNRDLRGVSVSSLFLRFKPARGFALPLVLAVIPIIAMLALITLSTTTRDLNFAVNDANSKRAFYIAEAGLAEGLNEFSATNYGKVTHESDGSIVDQSKRLEASLPNLSRDGEGWYAWEWKNGDGHRSFTGSGIYEKYRFRVYYINAKQWVLESEGTFGKVTRKLMVSGTTEPIFLYALFSDGNMSEFVRGQDQNITGWVHANGDLFFRPSGTTLTIDSDRVTASGKIVRYEDAWGRPDEGGTVRFRLSNGSVVLMEGRSQGRSGQGSAYDSYNSAWLNSGQGALSRYQGIVKDGSLGGSYVSPPAIESMHEGGYFQQQAGLQITPSSTGTGISTKTFYNQAEERYETVKELDMQQLGYPSNGLIYSDTPIRLVNAGKLKAPLMIVSNSNIYTIGDVNKEYATQEDYANQQQTRLPLALMSTSRIYHLSGAWDDGKSQSPTKTQQQASDPSLYSGDPANVVEVNAALVDGSILVDEINYVKEYGGETNPYYTGTYTSGVNAWANSDDYLEKWGSGVTMKKRGSIIHLENARMAKFDNSNAGPGITAWVRRSHYDPPKRDYSYDEMFGDPTSHPPFTPLVSSRAFWKEVK